MRPLVPAVLALALCAPSAVADDDVNHARQELALKEQAQDVKKACGVEPRTAIDWSTFPADYGNYSVSGYCSSALDALRRHCEGKAKKRYIQKRLKSVTCKYGGKGKRALRVKKGRVSVDLDFEASNYEAWARKELLRSF